MKRSELNKIMTDAEEDEAPLYLLGSEYPTCE